MRPREVIQKWVEAFNNADSSNLAEMYSEDAINYQVREDLLKAEKLSGKCLMKSLPVLKWFVLLRIFMRMENGQFWNGKTPSDFVGVVSSIL